MIFGKTYSERYKEDQERLKELHGKWFYSFAWLPTEMSNGEWVWLEKYQWRYDISKNKWGTYVDNDAIIRRSMRTKEWVENKLGGNE